MSIVDRNKKLELELAKARQYKKWAYKNVRSKPERHPRYKGFVLIAEYPGCRRKKGDFEPYTTGDFLNYPDVWKPVLHDDIARDEKLKQLGIK